MQTFVYTLHFVVCFILIAVVLLQRGKGADLGASLGGGGANTIFGSRGAGNFLTRITTASAIVFMGTSLTLAYLGYEASDIQLFDGDEPFDLPGAGATAEESEGGLVEIPADEGGLVEIQAVDDAVDAGAEAAASAGDAIDEAVSIPAADAGDAASDAAAETPSP